MRSEKIKNLRLRIAARSLPNYTRTPTFISFFLLLRVSRSPKMDPYSHGWKKKLNSERRV